MKSEVNVDAINAIVGQKNPVLRNLQITQAYSDLSKALFEVFHHENVSWCAFATWASKTAGQFIRRENLESTTKEFLKGQDWLNQIRETLPGLLTWFGWRVNINESLFVQIVNETFQAASQQVAEGNLMVFSELAPLYEKFLRILARKDQFEQEVLDQFLADLKIDDIGTDQRKLQRAFTLYYLALFEKDAKVKVEMILLANLLAGYHEQTRLDPAINNSIHAPVDQIFRKRLLGSVETWIEITLPRFLYALIYPLIKKKIEPVITRMSERWRRIMTKELMRIEVPEGHLDLSEDIPMIAYDSRGMFPAALQKLENTELLEILKEFDYTPDSTKGSGARDWGKLSDRMNFIADFFRSAQQDLRLTRSPFNEEQTDAIRNGNVPNGRL